jgi:hypothetical protein
VAEVVISMASKVLRLKRGYTVGRVPLTRMRPGPCTVKVSLLIQVLLLRTLSDLRHDDRLPVDSVNASVQHLWFVCCGSGSTTQFDLGLP